MPSRRQLLAGTGTALAGVVGGYAVETPISIDRAAGVDWPMSRYDPQATGHNPDASGPKDGVQVRWETQLDSLKPFAPPIAVGDTLFVVGTDSLTALDRATGTVKFNRTGHSYLSSPAYVSASAYRTDTLAVQGTGGLYGLSAGGGYGLGVTNLGLERWHTTGQKPKLPGDTAEPGLAKHVATEGTVYAVVPQTNRVVAIDPNSGDIDWEYTVEEKVTDNFNLGRPSLERPAVGDGTVYVTGWPFYVAAIDAETGREQWTIRPEQRDSPGANDYRVSSGPTLTDSGLVIQNEQTVVLLDTEDGSLEWEFPHDGDSETGVAVANRRVFVTADHLLYAIDLETGEEIWRTEYDYDRPPVVADGVVYLGDSVWWGKRVRAIDADTGERRWSYKLNLGASNPVVGDGVVYLTTSNTVVALEEGPHG